MAKIEFTQFHKDWIERTKKGVEKMQENPLSIEEIRSKQKKFRENLKKFNKKENP